MNNCVAHTEIEPGHPEHAGHNSQQNLSVSVSQRQGGVFKLGVEGDIRKVPDPSSRLASERLFQLETTLCVFVFVGFGGGVSGEFSGVSGGEEGRFLK